MPAPLFLQEATAGDVSGTSVASIAVTLPFPVTAGSLINTGVKHESANTTISVSDGTTTLTGGDYENNPFNTSHAQFHYLLSANSGSRTYTATFGASRDFPSIAATEYGPAAGAAGAVTFAGQNSANGSTNAPNSGSFTANGPSSVAFGMYGEDSANTSSNPQIAGQAADASVLNAAGFGGNGTGYWRRGFSAGFTGAATLSQAGSVDWACIGIAFDFLAPTITVQPTDQTIQVGAVATLSVTATASAGGLTYQWQRQNAATGAYDDMAGETAAALIIATTPQLDGARYRVRVTDSNGTTPSNTVTLRVLTQIAAMGPMGRGPWQPRWGLPTRGRTWSQMLDVRSWAPGPPLQIEKWFVDWLEPAQAGGATTVNCTVGNLALGNVAARVILTTNIGCTVGGLVLGTVNARVQLATAINTTRGDLVLGSVAARVQLATAVNATPSQLLLGGVRAGVNTNIGCTVGSLTLGGVPCTVIQTTVIRCTVGGMQLQGVPCTVVTQAATYINCSVGGMLLAGVQARIVDTTRVNVSTAGLTLGSVAARVILPTVIHCGVGGMTLGSVAAQVTRPTVINAGSGGLTLGHVNARIQLATAVNATRGDLQLRGVPATVAVTETTTINCGVGGLSLGGVPAQIIAEAPPTPEPPRTVGGGGGPGQWIVRRKRVRVALDDALDDLTVIHARTTPAIKPLVQQIAAIVDAAADGMRVVQRAHWTPARARVVADDEAADDVLVKVHVTDIDLQRFFDALMLED